MGDNKRVYGPSRTDVLFVDGSGNLKWKWAPPGGPWSSLVTVMTGCAANAIPEVSWVGSVLEVYVKGSGTDTLKSAWYDGTWYTATL